MTRPVAGRTGPRIARRDEGLLLCLGRVSQQAVLPNLR